MKTYLNLAIGAPRRLAFLRAYVAKHNASHGGDKPGHKVTWQSARYGNFRSHESLGQGFNGEGRARVPVWYAHNGAQFERERYADECSNAPRHVTDHTGYFCDDEGDSKARGVIVALPHGRFLAGYELSVNDERVYFGQVYSDEYDAACAADGHAESIADREREYDARFREAQRLDDEVETKSDRLRECLALRNHKCFEALRDEARELIEGIRAARETLATDYKGMV